MGSEMCIRDSPSLIEKSTTQGFSLAFLPLDRVLMRFPAARPRKTCDSVPLEMLLSAPAPPSLALLTRQSEIIVVSPGFLARGAVSRVAMAVSSFARKILVFNSRPRQNTRIGEMARWETRENIVFRFDKFFCFFSKKHLTFSVLFSIVFHNAICGKILDCGSSRTAAIFRPQNDSRQFAGSDPLAARWRQTADDCGGSGVFFRKPLSTTGVDQCVKNV